MVHVLVIDNALDHGLYQPVAHWRRAMPADVPVTGIHAPTEPLPIELSSYTHVIVSGSEASICQREPWAERESVWLRRLMQGGVPVLGSCWGHQLIAYAWAGERYIGRADKPELGWIPIEVVDRDDRLVGGESPAFFAFNVHFDEVPLLPPGFRVTARSAGCAVQAMRHESLPIHGLQSHPEISPDEGKAFLATVAPRYGQHAEQFRRALREEPQDSRAADRLVVRFLGR